MVTRRRLPLPIVWAVTLLCIALCKEALTMDTPSLIAALTPQPQRLTLGEGHFALAGREYLVELPGGSGNEACRDVLTTALTGSGVAAHPSVAGSDLFVIGERGAIPDLPTEGHSEDGYVLSITPKGVTARGASAAGLLYAAQTLRQLLRLSSEEGRLPCLTIVDYPEFRIRGIYVEGGQERFGKIVEKDYLLQQIRRLAEFKMNALVIECYNLFPYASFPACADEGTLSEEDFREIAAESKRYHVTLIPSLQTLAQAYELVWTREEGVPYREATAPGLMCPSNPDIYPFIKELYRDLLVRFDDTPIIGVGCSEIDMQWQQRYCPACQRRIDAGETVRDLLLGHAEKCIAAVKELAAELGRDVRPLMWGDEFYMYGPGKDWVGIERIPQSTVMGYWKYWADYDGIDGLLQRGYDVLGVSAMYNHTFYLADLSPEDPAKSWPSMEQTGTRNITEMLREADKADRTNSDAEFWGVATASFSKHRLRAFDSIWYGFALNGHAAWSRPTRGLDEYQEAFTRAFTRHYYDARTEESADALAQAYVRLDRCKSRLELANQTLHDVVGVYDTQEAGYQGNTLMDAFRKCHELTTAEGEPEPALANIRQSAAGIATEAAEVMTLLDAQRPHVGCVSELAYLWLAGEKIAAHAERQLLIIDAQSALARAEGQPIEVARERMATEANRWERHRERVERILRRTSHLYSRGDPLGLLALLRDLAAVETHLKHLAESGQPSAETSGREIPIDERFDALDEEKWIVLGDPRIGDGHLETRAPGGWENYCGIATRDPFDLLEERPLVVEFELTPIEMGRDSQLFGSAAETGKVAYQFTFYGSADRFGIHTQSAAELHGTWVSVEPGWKSRAWSPKVETATMYHVRAEITRRTWRVIVRERDESTWQPPLWDTGPVPMDELAQTRLVFADVEPEDSDGASRWGAIRIWRAK